MKLNAVSEIFNLCEDYNIQMEDGNQLLLLLSEESSFQTKCNFFCNGIWFHSQTFHN